MKQISPEIKQKAVNHLKEGRTTKEVAAEFGVTVNSINNWRRAAKVDPPPSRRYLRKTPKLIQLMPSETPVNARGLIAFYGSPLDVITAIKALPGALQ